MNVTLGPRWAPGSWTIIITLFSWLEIAMDCYQLHPNLALNTSTIDHYSIQVIHKPHIEGVPKWTSPILNLFFSFRYIRTHTQTYIHTVMHWENEWATNSTQQHEHNHPTRPLSLCSSSSSWCLALANLAEAKHGIAIAVLYVPRREIQCTTGFFKKNSHPIKFRTIHVMSHPSPKSMLYSELCVQCMAAFKKNSNFCS